MDVSCIRCVERARFWTKITSEIERSIPTIILLKLKEISECLTFVIGLSEFFTILQTRRNILSNVSHETHSSR